MEGRSERGREGGREGMKGEGGMKEGNISMNVGGSHP